MKPLPSRLEYTSLGDIKAIIPYEEINPVIFKPNIYYKKDDPGDTYIIDIIVGEDHMRCKDEVKESYPLKFDYEGITIFDPG